MNLPNFIAASLAHVHPSWQPILENAVRAVAHMDASYFPALEETAFLPTDNRLFAAFSQPLHAVRYVLVGEGPYPREESATGYCFMDGAVQDIWSEKGFSRQVNRATSLRNFLKMLLVAENSLSPDHTGAEAMAGIARLAQAADSPYISRLPELQQAMLGRGFLLLNAALVFRPHVPPAKETKAWQPFLGVVMDALAEDAALSGRALPLFILWGKMAERLAGLPALARFPQICSEHPYNLSFIRHIGMQQLFGPMNLLKNP